MGISSSPPCQPTDLFCKATQWALRAGVWTPYAQSSVVPAQYFRNQAKIDEYLSHESFLKDINNERANDTQPHSGAGVSAWTLQAQEEIKPRNVTYKAALTSLNNFVTFAFR
jgi:palmitoyl-protein thioesterase